MTTLDAYVTLEELTTYFSGDDRAAAFLALTDLQKTSYLNRATKAIDSVPVRGTKYDLNITDGAADQARAFPRIIDGEILDYNRTTGTTLVPPDVKYACMEEALALYSRQWWTKAITGSGSAVFYDWSESSLRHLLKAQEIGLCKAQRPGNSCVSTWDR